MHRPKTFHSILLFAAILFLPFSTRCSSGSGDNQAASISEETRPTYTGSGVTHKVPGDFATIQAALDAAGEGDAIIVRDGIYKGEGNKNLDFKGKTLLLRSENGPDNCIIDCERSGRGFVFHTHETLDALVEGFTVKNAFVRGPELKGYGAGIFCLGGASPRINNCKIVDNRADSDGGGISCYSDATPLITNCTIIDNKSAYGGGISLNFGGSPTIKNCTFSGNKARRGYAIFIGKESFPKIVNCTFAEKSKKNIYVFDSSDAEIINSDYK